MTKPPLRPALLLLGSGLRDLRTTRGLGLRALARKLGLAAADLSAWELGTRRPPAEAAAYILGYLQAKPVEYRHLMQLHRQSDQAAYVEDLGPEAGDLPPLSEKYAVRGWEWAPHAVPAVPPSAPPGIVLVGEAASRVADSAPPPTHVTVHVVPDGAGTSHGFRILELASGTITVVLRHEHTRIHLGDPRTIERYRATFSRLHRKALDRARETPR
ncbi:helix-turn-helix domain-containing protein [Amycolatopsis vancoresmycina]|uniref:XRE family transcriptional regulator n=1 Tax=Amycolatopsis vancoresmycina DSM 44592 TaxID=1292037 RepID=R1GBD3_9PSEU|nr:Scr1 family TA system antitoxin-like transcriptional regulator [Amycolatopsis vancoresmycina]EOD68648.1 XRE family transcriptional regulator [Amycolatopsis vancoresmycina DSM 44592]